MAKRTYNRQPKSVGMDYYEKQGLSDKYLNFNEFHGLNTNKNYLAIDQQSFADCDNVYVNQDGELSVRPPVKYYSPTVGVGDNVKIIVNNTDKVLQMIKLESVLFYHVFDGEKYWLKFAWHEKYFEIQTNEVIQLQWVQSWFVLFEHGYNEDNSKTSILLRAFDYNYSSKDLNFYEANDVIYTPTIVVNADKPVSDENKNILTHSYNDEYVIDSLDELPGSLTGKVLYITLDGYTYKFEYTQYSKYVITAALGYPLVQTPWTEIQVSKSTSGLMWYFALQNNIPYISYDGIIFVAIAGLPDDGYSTALNAYRSYKLCEEISGSGDSIGTRLWLVTKILDGPSLSVYYANIGPNSLPTSANDWISASITIPKQNKCNLKINNQNISMNYSETGDDTNPLDSYVRLSSDFSTNAFALTSPDYKCLMFLTKLDTNIKYIIDGIVSPDIVHPPAYTSGAFLLSICTINDEDNTINQNNAVLIREAIFSNFSRSKNIKMSATYVNDDANNIGYVIQICTQNSKTAMSVFYIVTKRDFTYYYYFDNFSQNQFCKVYGMFESFESTLVQQFSEYNISIDANVDNIQFPIFNNNLYTLGNKIYCKMAYTTPAVFQFSPSPSDNPSSDYLFSEQGIFKTTTWAPGGYYTDTYNYSGKTPEDERRRKHMPLIFVRDNVTPEGASSRTQTLLYDKNVMRLGKFAFSDTGGILGINYVYINNHAEELLLNSVEANGPRSANNTPVAITDKLSVVYLDEESKVLYSSFAYDKLVVRHLIVKGLNLFMPDFYIDGYKRAFAKDNQLYILSDADKQGKLYIKNVSVLSFESDITALINLSSTSIAIFLKDSVYILFENNGTNLVKSKLQLGNRKGSTVMNIYDGSSILLPTLNGLTSLSYEQFVQSTDQVYKYLSEQIMDNFDVYFEGKIKLKQYKRWIFMFRQDLHYFFLYDISANAWWKWTLPYPISNLEYDNENGLLLLMNNKICNFDLLYNTFVDFVDSKIYWNIITQKLHFNAPNNYKHVRAVNVITTQKGNRIRYKLKYKNYRNIDNTEEDDVRDFVIENLTTTINRVAFIKTNAFQVELSNDKSDNNAVPFITPGISIKYRITEKIR